MERRYEGFLTEKGLYVLDTYTGDVKYINSAEKAEVDVVSISSAEEKKSKALPNTQNLTSFENEVISSYPYLIARPFYDLLNEKDPRMKCKLMVDTFTAVLKFMALQLASEYLHADDVKDIKVHQTLVKDISRPLISAWNLLISRTIPVLRDADVKWFSPEIVKAYEKLESKCKQPFLVNQVYTDENGEEKTRTKKLGKIQALINYRNGLAHGFNQSRSRAQKELDEYLPVLLEILQEVRYMSRYTLWHVESNREGIQGIRLMGSAPTYRQVEFSREGINPSVSPLFLINDATGRTLPLFAFFDVDVADDNGLPELGKDVFVFEGNTKNTIVYVSSSGEYVEKASRFQHWKELLAQKDLDVEIITEKNLSTEIISAVGNRISAGGINTLISSGKYIREATVERRDLNVLLDQFMSGNFGTFVLGGESGIGKSTLLAQKVEEWQGEGHAVFFYRASALNTSDVSNKFIRDTGLKIFYFEDFLAMTDRIFNEEKKCLLVIDAINEFPGDINEVINALEAMVVQSEKYPWFKIVVSIRDSAYKRLSARFGRTRMDRYFEVEEEISGEKIKTPIVRLSPLSSEFVGELYDAYRNYKWKDPDDFEDPGIYKYRPLNEFNDLNPNGSTVKQLRNPLMARLILQAYHRATIPNYLRTDEAMKLYLENIVIEKTENSQGFPDRDRFLKLLVKELDRNNQETIDREVLLENSYFKPFLLNFQKDSPYVQLLDLGVLLEEWEKDKCYIRFAFDKFFEYLLAQYHLPRVNNVDDTLQLVKRIPDFRILEGAVEIILNNFCLEDQHKIIVDLIDLADESEEEIRRIITDIISKLLVKLAIESYDKFEKIIQMLPEDPSELDLSIIIKVINKLFTLGEIDALEQSIEVGLKEATIMGDKDSQSDIQLIHVQRKITIGKYDEATKILQEVIELKKEINDNIGLCNALLKLGDIFWKKSDHKNAIQVWEEILKISQENNDLNMKATVNEYFATYYRFKGEINEAEKLLIECLEIFRELNKKMSEADVLLELSRLYKAHGNNTKGEKLLLESLELYKDLGFKSGIAEAINLLANFRTGQGKKDDAEELYLKSLEIRKQLGDKKGVSGSLNNLAILYKNKGDIDKAEKYYLESMKIAKQLDDIKGTTTLYNNLAILYKGQGEMVKAEKMYKEALKIKRELGDKAGLPLSLNNLAYLYKGIGEIEEAEKMFQEAMEIRKQSKDEKGVSGSLCILAGIRCEQGDPKEAERMYLEALEIRTRLEDTGLIASTMNNLGELYCSQGKLQEGEENYLEALKIRKQTDNKTAIPASYRILGGFYKDFRKDQDAEKMYIDALTLEEKSESKPKIAVTLNALGTYYREQGNVIEAEEKYRESLEIRKELNTPIDISASQNSLGRLYLELGRIDEAEKHLLEALKIRKKSSSVHGIAYVNTCLGNLEFEKNNDKKAKKHSLQALRIYVDIDKKRLVLGQLHRTYSLFSKVERAKYLKKAKEIAGLFNFTSTDSLAANIILMNNCLDNKDLTAKQLKEYVSEVRNKLKLTSIFNIDELPVEAYYHASLKFKELGEAKEAAKTAKAALLLIGNRVTRRKNELEKLAKQK